MRLDRPRSSFRSGSLVERSNLEESSDMEAHGDLEEFSGSEALSDSQEFSGSEESNDSDECSDLKEHSNLKRSSKRERHLELSIHEICHYRLGPALWTYRRDSDKGRDLDDLLKPLRSLTDISSNTFDKNLIGQMKLFAMIHEVGLLDFHSPVKKDPGLSSIISLL